MKQFFFLFILLSAFSSFAQNQLYRDSIYNYKKVVKETYDFITVNDEKLEFDFYKAKEASGLMPLIIYVHGGGFVSGQRDTKGIIQFAKRMASRGYAVASVSYRLTMKDVGFGCETAIEEKKRAINDASGDVLMAVKKILGETSIFQIDKEKIVLLGSSAGAETVLNLAYMTDYSKEIEGIKFAGVISMAGALIDLNSINFENAIPTQMFHGTGDPLVPYGIAAHHFCPNNDPGYLMLYGSSSIAERLKGMGKSYYLYSVTGGGHEWAGKPIYSCFTDIVDFLYNDVMSPSIKRQTERTIVIPYNE